MIERINLINRVYAGFIEQHLYKTQLDPKTLKAQQEHLVCRVYTKTARIEETDFKHTVDRLA